MREDRVFLLTALCVLGILGLAAGSYVWQLGDGQSFPAHIVEVALATLKDVTLMLVGGKLALTVGRQAPNGNGNGYPPGPSGSPTP